MIVKNGDNACTLQGLYQDKPPLPFIPGSEVSGIVTEVGAKVKSVKQGDHVCPFHMSHDQAPSNPMTLLQSLLHRLSSRRCSPRAQVNQAWHAAGVRRDKGRCFCGGGLPE